MQRHLWAVAVLLGVAVTGARADFIKILVTVGGPVTPASPAAGGAAPGGAPMPPAPAPVPAPPPAPTAASLADTSAVQTEVIVEVKKYRKRGNYLQVETKWGTTTLTENDMFKVKRVPVPTVAERYKVKKEAIYRKPGRTPEEVLDLAEWALTHGMLQPKDWTPEGEPPTAKGEFATLMADLAKLSPNHPVVDAYNKVQAAMKQPVANEDAAAFWQDKLGNYKVEHSAHYSLLYTSKIDASEVQSHIDKLERNYYAFFYWFALRGRVMPVPDRRLVAVLVDNKQEYELQYRAFDLRGGPATSSEGEQDKRLPDGFFARRENLVVFCAELQDEGYDLLSKSTKNLWTSGWDKKKLLKGGVKKGETDEAIINAQMVALVLTAMEEQLELATVSHQGSLQLAVATGLLSRNVAVPSWLQFGIGSFFETPREAFWDGTGAPSWKYLVQFKIWEDAKTLDKPEEALRTVITDHGFRVADQTRDPQHLLKARTMAWALTYYLMKRRLDGLTRYCQDLATLPRDLEFDEDVLLASFARAFDLVDASRPNEVNPSKFRDLAFDWYHEISGTPIEVPDILKDAIKDKKEQTAKKPSKADEEAAKKAQKAMQDYLKNLQKQQEEALKQIQAGMKSSGGKRGR